MARKRPGRCGRSWLFAWWAALCLLLLVCVQIYTASLASAGAAGAERPARVSLGGRGWGENKSGLRGDREAAPADPPRAPPSGQEGLGAGSDALKTPQSPAPASRIYFQLHAGKSCQGYVEDSPVIRSLDDSKGACLANERCRAIECGHGRQSDCTMRGLANKVDYAPADCYEKVDPDDEAAKVHPAYASLLKEYPFQPVWTQLGQEVNIILVRAPFGAQGGFERERKLYDKYKNDILFLGISSFEDYPLDAMNPYSPRLDVNYFLGAFPGFLHMMHRPEEHFPPHVKTILMSQSDFQLPDVPLQSLSVTKKYDFVYAATWPLGTSAKDSNCIGWAGYCKNWSFTREALRVMCGEYNLNGVLVATQDKAGANKCSIPEVCQGKVLQTSFIKQEVLFDYMKQSRFSFLPQMHDASPRVITQAFVHDVPILMNKHISGGWKYINDKTGEFFHDMRDFRASLEKILRTAAIPGAYQPREWVLANYGNEHAGKRLLAFVKEHFSHRVQLPKHTRWLWT